MLAVNLRSLVWLLDFVEVFGGRVAHHHLGAVRVLLRSPVLAHLLGDYLALVNTLLIVDLHLPAVVILLEELLHALLLRLVLVAAHLLL